MLRIYPVILRLVQEVARVAPAIAAHDADLARQLRRALASVPLNTGEGMYSQGAIRTSRYHTAAGSAREVLSCLEVAVAFGYLKEVPPEVLALLNRVIGTLVRLVKPACGAG